MYSMPYIEVGSLLPFIRIVPEPGMSRFSSVEFKFWLLTAPALFQHYIHMRQSIGHVISQNHMSSS